MSSGLRSALPPYLCGCLIPRVRFAASKMLPYRGRWLGHLLSSESSPPVCAHSRLRFVGRNLGAGAVCKMSR